MKEDCKNVRMLLNETELQSEARFPETTKSVDFTRLPEISRHKQQQNIDNSYM